MQQLVERLIQGDRRALARMVTLIENDLARPYLGELHRHTNNAHILGVTGAPGAGKSSLVTCLVRELRRREQRVGVIAVDPSSPYSGGAILGDRIRMQELAGDPNVFIRSMANRGTLGGLATSTRDVVRAMDAAGYNPIIIETVGTGQAEVEVMSAAQTVLVVVAPGMGDDIQAIKAGILEIADIFVVSKADKTGADQTAAELNMLLSLTANRRQQDWHIPIIQTSSHTGQGITALADALQRHRDYLVASASLEQRAQRQARSEIQALVFQAVARALQQAVSENEWQALIRDVLSQQRDPYSIAAEIQARLGLPETQHENH